MKHLKKAISSINISMEELSDGVTRVEKEHVFYGRIVDFDQLKKAAEVIKQEQWTIKVAKTDNNLSKGQLRVRKNIEGNETSYVFTLKTFRSDDSRLEVSMDGSADAFEVFRMLSDCGMIKHRYVFPVEGSSLKFEIDVFLKPDGTYHSWCKVDVEVEDMSIPLPAFPITLANVIRETGDNMPEEQRKIVTDLYDQYFLTKPGKSYSGDGPPVAMESLMDDLKGYIKSIFKNSRKKERDEIENTALKDIDKTIKLLKETFLDKDWMDGQKLTKEPIRVNKIITALSVQGELSKNVNQDIRQTVDQLVLFGNLCKPKYRDYSIQANKIIKTLHNVSDNPGKQWESACRELDKLDMPGNFAMAHEPNVKKMIGGVTIGRIKSHSSLYDQTPEITLSRFSSDKEIQPLNSSEIVEMAETVIYVLEKFYRNNPIQEAGSYLYKIDNTQFGDFSDDVLDRYDSDYSGNIYESTVYEINSLTDQVSDPIFEYSNGFNTLMNNAVSAMLSWINHSFK